MFRLPLRVVLFVLFYLLPFRCASAVTYLYFESFKAPSVSTSIFQFQIYDTTAFLPVKLVTYKFDTMITFSRKIFTLILHFYIIKLEYAGVYQQCLFESR